MNIKTLFAVSVLAGAAVTTIAMKIAHKRGCKAGINSLREGQLQQAKVELDEALSNNTSDLELEWEIMELYEAEVQQINEIYDEVINNL